MDEWFRLAKLYGADDPGMLMFPPPAAARATAIQAAWTIAATLPAEDCQRWLDLGMSLKRAASRDEALGDMATG